MLCEAWDLRCWWKLITLIAFKQATMTSMVKNDGVVNEESNLLLHVMIYRDVREKNMKIWCDYFDYFTVYEARYYRNWVHSQIISSDYWKLKPSCCESNERDVE